MQKPLTNLRLFLSELRKHGELVDVYHPVDSHLELPEIHRRVAAANGPALFFHKVHHSTFPVVTNLFGSEKRIEIAFQNRPEILIKQLTEIATQDFPPKWKQLWEKRTALKSFLHLGSRKKRWAPILEEKMPEPDLEKLPLLKTWPLDGGHFITLPLVYTEPYGQKGAPNLGMYRIQRYSKKQAGLHFQIAKGGGFHYSQAEKLNQRFPVAIFIGGPPALILSAITPLPENVPEILLCGLLQGKKLDLVRQEHPYPLIGECEFALMGYSPPHIRRPEGPFGDHYGYYSWTHDFPVFECEAIYHRKDAIYPATVVGKPKQEDLYIGNYLQELLSPLFPIVMPAVKALWSYGEAGFHSLAAAIVKERYFRESMSSAFRILGEGQLALTKFLILTDQSTDLKDFKSLLKIVLERFQPQTDLYIFSHLSLDTLDYTGPELNKGSRGVLLGIGEKKRDLPTHFQGSLPLPVKKVGVFTPGCLVLEVPSFQEFSDFSHLLSHSDFQKWPLIIIVDNVDKALKSSDAFLWTTFTRFEPAADIHFHSQKAIRHHLCYQGPMLIDARMKPSYPPEVLCDDATYAKVSHQWHHYFPQGMPMGDSLSAHV